MDGRVEKEVLDVEKERGIKGPVGTVERWAIRQMSVWV